MSIISNQIRSKTLRSTLRRTAVISGILLFVIVFSISFYLGFQKTSEDELKQHQSIHKILGELTAPSLAIHDYSDVKKLLGQVSDKQTVFALISSTNDILLSDDEFRSLVESLHKNGNSSCEDIQGSNISFSGKTYRSYCSVLEKESSLAIPNAVRALQISFHEKASVWSFLSISMLFAGLASLTLIGTLTLFMTLTGHRMLSPLESLTREILLLSKNPLDENIHIRESNDPHEIQTLRKAFSTLLFNFRRQHEESRDAIRRAALYEQARQIGHDIKSPLLALTDIAQSATISPDDKRIILREAVRRIHDIANQLVEMRNKNCETPLESGQYSSRPCLIATILGSIVSEKRCQYRNRHDLNIIEDYDQNAIGVFSKIPRSELGRVISNIIDNSCDAILKNGVISISLKNQDNNKFLIEIKDNGKGIAPENLGKIFDAGFSYGKKHGSGLGLSSAKTIVENSGGIIQVESSLKGTIVSIVLEKVQTPSWFLNKLDLPKNALVIIADDDQSVHHVWASRLKDTCSNNIIHIHSPDELKKYVRSLGTSALNARFLIDQEFLNCSSSGLNAIKNLGISSQSVLVTSLFEDDAVIAECEKNSIKLLPKSFVSSIQLAIY